MYCRNCGKQLSDGAIMCPECGEPTKPLGTAPCVKENVTETPKGNSKLVDLLGIIGFFLSMFAFVTGIIFGAFMYVYPAAAPLLLVIGFTSILPALVGISICIPAVKDEKANIKALAITGIVLSAIVLLFLFITACVICTLVL